MIDSELAASIALIAFGVNFFGAVLLLLLNAGSRSVRWYLPFQLCILLWLLAQAADFMRPHPVWSGLLAFSVVMMPLMFLVFAIMDSGARPAWQAMVVLLLSAPLLAFVMEGIFMSSAPPLARNVATFWSVGGWIGGSVLLWLQTRRPGYARQGTLRKKIFLLSFVLMAPISVVAAILFDGGWFIALGMPVITMFIMFLIFYGMTRMQFYDIEVRVRRTGDIAAQTVETERLALLGELAATIAHEVRNPLTGVRSLAQRIAGDEIGSEKRRQYAEVILDETARVEKLVSNLLDLSKRGSRLPSPTPAPAQLAPLFADLTLLVGGRAARKDLTISSAVNENVMVNASRDAATQALLNLLLNAINHAPEHTTIDLVAQYRADGTDVMVRDRGPGIPAGERDHIFEPFYTTRAEGTGLGLSVVRHLAREHGWTISVNDAPGGGTEFHLLIPSASVPV